MRSLLLFLIFLLAAAWISFARYYYVCVIKKNCQQELPDSPRAQTLELTYQDSVLLSGYEEFAFTPKGTEAQLTPNNLVFIDTLADFLNSHPDLRLTIEGLYLQSESGISSGFHENLGQARADVIRNLLLNQGVTDSITLNFHLVDGGQLDQPVKFSIFDPINIPEEYEKVLFTFHNMTFSDANFEYDSDVFKPGTALISYADSVKTYLGEHLSSQLTITGHTDSRGTRSYNQDLGLRRAKSARSYFEALGITNSINVDTKGEEKPMAPNDTEENQQKNRRVNFQIE